MKEKKTCFSYGNYTPEMLLAFLIERLFSCCFWPKAYAQSDWYERHCLEDDLKIDLIRNNSEWMAPYQKEKQSPLWQWTNEHICSRIFIWEYLNLKYAFHLFPYKWIFKGWNFKWIKLFTQSDVEKEILFPQKNEFHNVLLIRYKWPK